MMQDNALPNSRHAKAESLEVHERSLVPHQVRIRAWVTEAVQAGHRPYSCGQTRIHASFSVLTDQDWKMTQLQDREANLVDGFRLGKL